jgi:uncharacterized protein
VQLALPELGRGWLYFPPMARELRNCIAGKPQAIRTKPAAACSQQERMLGLCR